MTCFIFLLKKSLYANRGYGAFAESVRLYDAFVGKGAIPSNHGKRSADVHLPAWCFWNYDSRRGTTRSLAFLVRGYCFKGLLLNLREYFGRASEESQGRLWAMSGRNEKNSF